MVFLEFPKSFYQNIVEHVKDIQCIAMQNPIVSILHILN